MKIFVVLFALFMCVNICCASPYSQTFDKMENVLFGFQYSGESDDSRLKRIEESVYGSPSGGNIQNRMTKLKKDLSADLMGQEIEPKEDTFEEEIEDDVILSDANIQYPAIDELEQVVFNTKYPKKEIKQRLSALEQKTFGKTYSDDLSTRVDRLKAQIRPSSLMANNIAQSSNDFFDRDDVIPLEKDYYLDRYESPNRFDYDAYNASHNPLKKANISTVEKKLLKHNYSNENMDKRLSRLENVMFGTEFSDDDEQTRANRIASAYQAQKSSAKYDSNKWQQHMATGMQLGMLILMVLACIL